MIRSQQFFPDNSTALRISLSGLIVAPLVVNNREAVQCRRGNGVFLHLRSLKNAQSSMVILFGFERIALFAIKTSDAYKLSGEIRMISPQHLFLNFQNPQIERFRCCIVTCFAVVNRQKCERVCYQKIVRPQQFFSNFNRTYQKWTRFGELALAIKAPILED